MAILGCKAGEDFRIILPKAGMDMADMYRPEEHLLKVLEGSSKGGLDLTSLMRALSPYWEEAVFGSLIDLWKEGRIFASKVDRQAVEYRPTRQSKWSLSRAEGYFGYHPASGLYQIRSSESPETKLQLLATFRIGSPINSIAVAPDEDQFLLGLYSGEIAFGSIRAGTIYKRFKAHDMRIWSLDFSPDGKNFVSGSQDGRIIIWEVGSENHEILAEVDDWVTSVCYSPMGDRVLSGHKLADPENPPVRIWNIGSKKSEESFFHHQKGNVYTVGFLPDGRGFVSGGSDNNVAYWSFEKQDLIFQSNKHTGTVTCLSVNPQRNIVVSGAWTGTLKFWDLDSGEVLRTVEAHNSRVTSIAHSGSGELLVSGGRDSLIAVWRILEGALLTSSAAHDGWVRAVAFAARDQVVISGGSEGSCKIWKLSTLIDDAETELTRQ